MRFLEAKKVGAEVNQVARLQPDALDALAVDERSRLRLLVGKDVSPGDVFEDRMADRDGTVPQDDVRRLASAEGERPLRQRD